LPDGAGVSNRFSDGRHKQVRGRTCMLPFGHRG
jgi:hypothetical protein